MSSFLVFRCATDEFDEHSKRSRNHGTSFYFYRKTKNYFKKNNTLGTLKKLNLELKDSEHFIYSISKDGSRWTVKNKEDWEKCPAGSEWRVSVSITGFFEQKINFYRALPKNTHCAEWTKGFKNVGKPLPKAK